MITIKKIFTKCDVKKMNLLLKNNIIDDYAMNQNYIILSGESKGWLFDIAFRIMYESITLNRKPEYLSTIEEMEDGKILFNLVLSISECLIFINKCHYTISAVQRATAIDNNTVDETNDRNKIKLDSVRVIIDKLKEFLCPNKSNTSIIQKYPKDVTDIFTSITYLKEQQTHWSFDNEKLNNVSELIDESIVKKTSINETLKENIETCIVYGSEFDVHDILDRKQVEGYCLLLTEFKRNKDINETAKLLSLYNNIPITNIVYNKYFVNIAYSVNDISELPNISSHIRLTYKKIM